MKNDSYNTLNAERTGCGDTAFGSLAGTMGLSMTTLSSSWKLDSMSKSLKFW